MLTKVFWVGLALIRLTCGGVTRGGMLDPSDFLLGTHHRPRIGTLPPPASLSLTCAAEIIHPHNGEVLDTGDLRIEIKVDGYSMPSNFHTSKICVGISAGFDFSEQCFQQTDLIFHANGLSAGSQYALRVVLLERSQAIAVSVRHFRVGGIRGANSDLLTIRTAVQLAVALHTGDGAAEAEGIYRAILAEDPAYPDANHLLGLLLYGKGAYEEAVGYAEKAVEVTSVSVYHTTLGACYKRIGRLQDARMHFMKAIDGQDTPEAVAYFNLALVTQELGDWETAIGLYRKVTSDEVDKSTLTENIREQARFRECDLLSAMKRFYEAKVCWEAAVRAYPSAPAMHLELGGILATLGDIEQALSTFESAQALGAAAHENMALMTEALGDTAKAMVLWDSIPADPLRGQVSFYVRFRRACVLPRIAVGPLEDMYASHLQGLTALLGAVEEDNTSPMNRQHFLGSAYLYLFPQAKEVKEVLYRIYSRYCPALTTGWFTESPQALRSYHKDQLLPAAASEATEEKDVVPAQSHGVMQAVGGGNPNPSPTPSGRPLKVLFLSRFFYHPMDLLVSGLLPLLAASQALEVHVGIIERGTRHLATLPHIQYHYLGSDLAVVHNYLHALQLDAIIYPELSLDPLTYFLAFAPLAPVQVVLGVHPTTSGIPLGYFLSTSEVELPSAQERYSEQLVLFPRFGTVFQDIYTTEEVMVPDAGLNPNPGRLLQSLGIPLTAHVYVIGYAVNKLHYLFDEVVRKLLRYDKLAHLLIADTVPRRTSWELLYTQRLNTSDVERIHFLTLGEDNTTEEVLRSAHVVLEPYPVGGLAIPLAALAMGVPVVTMPSEVAAGRMALGLYKMLGYGQADDPALMKESFYTPLVVQSPKDYVNVALKLAFQPKLRAFHVSNILSRRGRLFGGQQEQQHMTSLWVDFLQEAHRNHTGSHLVTL